MAKYLFIAQSDCSDPAREEEFKEWLDQVHVPDIIVAPGIQKASSFINIDPAGNQRPKYMVIYEIETDDIHKFSEEFGRVIKKAEKAGRILDIMVPEKAYPFAVTFYQKVKNYRKPAASRARHKK